jgi:alpha-glucoside transport system substrate-binding protein
MFTNPPGCYLDHEPSFIISSYQNYSGETLKPLKPGENFDFFPFPASIADRAFQVSADIAVMFHDTTQARQLIKYLTTAKAQAIWPHIGGGAFSVNKEVNRGVYPDGVSKKISAELSNSSTLCYSASDSMPTAMRDAFYRAVLEYLGDPSQLDHLLDELDEVRQVIPPGEWLTIPCGQ